MSANIRDIISGDDISMPIQLYKNGAKFIINTNAVVKAAVVDKRHSTILIAAVTLSSAASGSAWATSLVVATFTSAQTAPLASNDEAWIEIEVNDTGKQTFFAPVRLIKGLI